MKLGRAPKQPDPRTLHFKAMRAAPFAALPPAYSWDAEHPGAVPVPVFNNDIHGNCVIAGRGHHTLRMEHDEQGIAIPITKEEVDAEYFAESGGIDSGLVVLYSLRDWRNKGWIAGGKHYSIHAYMGVSAQNHDDVKEAMLVGVGLEFGVNLPVSASDQMNAGEPWHVVAGPRGVPGSWGGHLVHASAYDARGVTCETWGKRQLMEWSWLDEYADECWLVIDNPNRLNVPAPIIDVSRLSTALGSL